MDNLSVSEELRLCSQCGIKNYTQITGRFLAIQFCYLEATNMKNKLIMSEKINFYCKDCHNIWEEPMFYCARETVESGKKKFEELSIFPSFSL